MSRIPLLSPLQALFVDFDGTLIDLAERPESVQIPDGLPQLLQDLETMLGGALAILTGRQLSSVDRLLDMDMRMFCAAGVHGAELRLDHRLPAMTSSKPLELAHWLQQRLAGDPLILVEDKGVAVALHYRAAPARGAEMKALLREAVTASGDELEIVPGKFVFEARPRGVDKGTALHRFMRQAPFSGRVPVFVGDDVTDEDAILAAQALGGFGIKVGQGPSAAIYREENPAAVRAWLSASLHAMQTDRESA